MMGVIMATFVPRTENDELFMYWTLSSSRWLPNKCVIVGDSPKLGQISPKWGKVGTFKASFHYILVIILEIDLKKFQLVQVGANLTQVCHARKYCSGKLEILLENVDI